jgi:hypothetical protein
VQPFRRVFNLAEYVAVKEASFENGTLRIALVREVPEAMKRHRIAIESAVGDDRKNEQRRWPDCCAPAVSNYLKENTQWHFVISFLGTTARGT